VSVTRRVDRVRFATAVVLTKREAFGACEACAEAERSLLRLRRPVEAAQVAALFELIEGRLVADGGYDLAGSNSSDNEFTQ
jgi:hypothetical protein